MKNKLRDVVETLEFDELVKMKADLEHGAVHLKKLVDAEIKRNEKTHEGVCSVCSSDVHPENTSSFTLLFGPDSFKKKATFCAMDCLEYFLNDIKKIKMEVIEKSN